MMAKGTAMALRHHARPILFPLSSEAPEAIEASGGGSAAFPKARSRRGSSKLPGANFTRCPRPQHMIFKAVFYTGFST